MDPRTAFVDLMIAAMKDAALTMSLSQFVAQIDPDGTGVRKVRIIVVPEKMEYTNPDGSPFGADPRRN